MKTLTRLISWRWKRNDLNGKWLCSPWEINRFEKKAGRKMNYNNQQPARFDRRKVRCYKCLQLGHFARECNVKTVDDKARLCGENKMLRLQRLWEDGCGLMLMNSGADISNVLMSLPCDGKLSKPQDHDQRLPTGCDIRTLPESDVEDPNSTAGSPSFSCSENVKSPRIICNNSGMNNRNVCKNNSVRVKKCFVCGSKLHLIKDCDFYNCVDSVPCKSKAASVPAGSKNSPASDNAGGSNPAASRNRPAVNSAGRPNPAGWSKRPAPVSAGRPVSAGWLNPAARPYFRPSSVYFNNMYWPELYDPMNKGRWGTAGDPSTDNDIGIVDSGCSRSMTGNKEKLDDFVQVQGGIVKFGGGDGRITGKGTIVLSTICIVKNPVFHQRTKHIKIRHHFIRDANEKNLIQVLKIHTDDNVADLLTKAFDGPRFEYLVVHIGMVVHTAARCTFFLLTGLVSAGRTMILLVVILSAERLVSAGRTMILLVVILSAGRLVSAGRTMILLVVILPAGCFGVCSCWCTWFLLMVDSFCWLNTFMLLNCFCCAQFDIAGWLVSATSHLVFAGSLQSCWCNNVSTDHIPIALLFESTSGGINEFFLESDEEEQIGMSRVVADPDSDDEVFAEIIFRGKSISGDGVVFVDKLPDDEIVDPRVKVETVSESAFSPPRSRSKHLGVRSDDYLWDKPVE
ncbi:ribonuclease H-like domain-containing protein, partial [Tanacetum coccineum]